MMELWNEFDRLVVFDTETTGIEFGTDRIIEIGAAALENGEEQGGFNALIRLPAGQTLPHFITQLTGITDEQLRDEGVWTTARQRRGSAACWTARSSRCWWPTTPSLI